MLNFHSHGENDKYLNNNSQSIRIKINSPQSINFSSLFNINQPQMALNNISFTF